MSRSIFISLGWLSFGTGLIGAFLPVLPTTPFMLLAGYCFSRSSPTLHAWLLRRPGIGPIVRDWELHGSISLRAKLTASVMMILLMSYPVLFKPYSLALKGLLVVIAASVMRFLWTRPTTPRSHFKNSLVTRVAVDPAGKDAGRKCAELYPR